MILNYEAGCFFSTVTLYWCFAIWNLMISQAKTGLEKKNSDMSLTIYIVYVYKYLFILNSF